MNITLILMKVARERFMEDLAPARFSGPTGWLEHPKPGENDKCVGLNRAPLPCKGIITPLTVFL